MVEVIAGAVSSQENAAIFFLPRTRRKEIKMRTDFKKNAAVAIFFFSFMFLQFVILRMGNQAGRGFLPDGQQENVYIFLQVFVICGIALHIVLSSALKKDRALKIIPTAALAICGVCSTYMLFAPISHPCVSPPI